MTLLEKAREICVPIQTVKKTKTAKQSKPASSGAATSDAPAREVKKAAEESKKTKSTENKKPAAKKVFIHSSYFLLDGKDKKLTFPKY